MRMTLLTLLGCFILMPKVYAVPVPALLIGADFLLLLIPTIVGFFSVIYFYFRKYIFYINIFLFILSGSLYFIHYLITDEVFLYEYEYFVFFFIFVFCIFISKIYNLRYLTYSITFFLLLITVFLTNVDINILKYQKFVKNFIFIIGEDSIDSYQIKDNFLVIKFTSERKELVLSNCYEGMDSKNILLRKVGRDFDKYPLESGYCIYGNSGHLEYNIMLDIIGD